MTAWVRKRSTNVWLGVLAIVVVFSFVLSAWTVVRQQNEASLRAADRKANATSQVSQCYQQVKSTPAVLTILNLIDGLATNSILGNRQALKLAKRDDPLRPVRLRSLERLVPAQKKLALYIEQTKAKAPTVKGCDTLAASLGVDATKLRPKGTS